MAKFSAANCRLRWGALNRDNGTDAALCASASTHKAALRTKKNSPDKHLRDLRPKLIFITQVVLQHPVLVTTR